MTPRIAIDAGHGGSDPGAVSGSLREKDLVLADARALRDYLTQNYNNVQITMTRNSDTFVSLNERANIANRANADYFISLHYNAFNGSARGYEDFTWNSLSANHRTNQLRNVVHDEVRKVLSRYNIPNRGKKSANFAVVRQTTMPAILVETLFIDNRTDQGLINQTNFRRDMVKAYGDGIAKALGLTRRTTNTGGSTGGTNTTGIIYRVQTGAFSLRRNAENLQARLRNDGFNSFLVQSGGLYRVNVGSFSSRGNADRLAQQLRNRGYATYINSVRL